MTAREEFAAMLSRFSPDIQRLAKSLLQKLTARMPGATRLVYDNYNALVVGYGPSEKASEFPFSVAIYPKSILLFFLRGTLLPDPTKRLRGSGRQVRSIQVEDAAALEEPAVKKLISAALKLQPIPSAPKGQLKIRAVAKKQRPRRAPPA